jgi:hypothetical protein
MSIIGGYIPGTKSFRLHPIKNIIIKKNGWDTLKLIVADKEMEFINNGGELKFTIKINYDDYTINLHIEDKGNVMNVYSSKNIFHYTIIFNEPIKKNILEDIVKFVDDTIYDG